MISSNRAQQTRLRRQRKDGTYMWVDTTLHNYLNQPGRNCVVVEIIDISAEMAAQEALHEHEELLRRLTDAMPVGLLQIDTDRDVVYNNACLLDILYGCEPLETSASLEGAPETHGEVPAPGAHGDATAPAAPSRRCCRRSRRRASRPSTPSWTRCSARGSTETSRSTSRCPPAPGAAP